MLVNKLRVFFFTFLTNPKLSLNTADVIMSSQAYFATILVDRAKARVFGGVVLNWFRRTLERIGLIRRTPSNADLDPDLKYVNVRRYLGYLEHSIEVRTQWAVFEANNDLLWASARREIENFLYQ